MAYSSDKTKVLVALDTSILFAISQFRIDVFNDIERLLGETEFCIPKAVEAELECLAKKNKKEVNVAISLIGLRNVKIIDNGLEKADNALQEMAKQGFIVATADKELKKKIKAFGGRIIYPRQKKYLEIE